MLVSEGRQDGGRFAAGNTFSSGSGYAKRFHELRRLIQQETTDQDTVEVWRAIVSDAKAGDPVARKLFCDYAFGRPTQPIEVTSGDDGGSSGASLIPRILAWLEAKFPGKPEMRYELAAFLHSVDDGPMAVEAIEGPAEQRATPIGAGPIGQSAVEASSTVRESYKREFSGNE